MIALWFWNHSVLKHHWNLRSYGIDLELFYFIHHYYWSITEKFHLHCTFNIEFSWYRGNSDHSWFWLFLPFNLYIYIHTCSKYTLVFCVYCWHWQLNCVMWNSNTLKEIQSHTTTSTSWRCVRIVCVRFHWIFIAVEFQNRAEIYWHIFDYLSTHIIIDCLCDTFWLNTNLTNWTSLRNAIKYIHICELPTHLTLDTFYIKLQPSVSIFHIILSLNLSEWWWMYINEKPIFKIVIQSFVGLILWWFIWNVNLQFSCARIWRTDYYIYNIVPFFPHF